MMVDFLRASRSLMHKKKLRRYKAVGKLCTKVVNDQKITVVNKIFSRIRFCLSGKSILRQFVKKIKS